MPIVIEELHADLDPAPAPQAPAATQAEPPSPALDERALADWLRQHAWAEARLLAD